MNLRDELKEAIRHRSLAMTLEEAKQTPSLAPWVDHRLFNNWNWTRSMANVREGLRRTARARPPLRWPRP